MKKKFVVKIDDVETTLYASKPGKRQETQARVISNKAFKNALENGGIFKKKLNEYLVSQGVLTKEEETVINECSKVIEDGKKRLKGGGIELSEARKIALEMRKARYKMLSVTIKINEHESYTVEGQTDDAYFDALVAYCTLKEDGKPLFSSYEDYLDKAYEDYAVECAKQMASLIYGDNQNWEKDLPENKFLIEYKFVDKDLRLVNDKGQLVDSENRLINEDGRYINDKNEFVDIEGNRVDENGDPIVEYSPFLKDGQPV
jgi:hypothetical protein